MAEEKIYFEEGDVKVTNARFLTYGKMHSMANVTSVAKYVVVRKIAPNLSLNNKSKQRRT